MPLCPSAKISCLHHEPAHRRLCPSLYQPSALSPQPPHLASCVKTYCFNSLLAASGSFTTYSADRQDGQACGHLGKAMMTTREQRIPCSICGAARRCRLLRVQLFACGIHTGEWERQRTSLRGPATIHKHSPPAFLAITDSYCLAVSLLSLASAGSAAARALCTRPASLAAMTTGQCQSLDDGRLQEWERAAAGGRSACGGGRRSGRRPGEGTPAGDAGRMLPSQAPKWRGDRRQRVQRACQGLPAAGRCG